MFLLLSLLRLYSSVCIHVNEFITPKTNNDLPFLVQQELVVSNTLVPSQLVWVSTLYRHPKGRDYERETQDPLMVLEG